MSSSTTATVVGALLTFVAVAYSSVRTSSTSQLGQLGMSVRVRRSRSLPWRQREKKRRRRFAFYPLPSLADPPFSTCPLSLHVLAFLQKSEEADVLLPSSSSDDNDDDEGANDNEKDGVSYSWMFFHITFTFAAFYLMEVLTDWSVIKYVARDRGCARRGEEQ